MNSFNIPDNIEIISDTTHNQISEIDFFYKSDNLRVRGYLSIPINHPTPIPLIVLNHGGIKGIYDGLKAIAHLLSENHGYAVLAPSYRGEDGSDGEIEIAHGEVDDVLNGTRLILESSDIDQNQVYMVGGSHGALITLIAMAKDTDGIIKKGVCAYGIMDIFKWWDYMRKNELLDDVLVANEYYPGHPEDNYDWFKRRHGLDYADRINAPVLIIHGDADWLVPHDQAHILYDAMKEAGKSVEIEIIKGGEHGILTERDTPPDGTKTQSNHCIQVWERILGFFN